MNNFSSRTELLVGNGGIAKLANARVLIAGLGGVGGICAVLIARAGIGNLTIVDYDIVDITNINRQAVAFHSTVGKFKVDVLEKQLLDINPKINITKLIMRINEANVESIIKNSDFIADAIDELDAKVSLIKAAVNKQKQIVSSMGAGRRISNPNFQVVDVFKTQYDPLARVMRMRLKEAGINSLKVICPFSSPIPSTSKEVGSISYAPTIAGSMLACEIVNAVLDKQ